MANESQYLIAIIILMVLILIILIKVREIHQELQKFKTQSDLIINSRVNETLLHRVEKVRKEERRIAERDHQTLKNDMSMIKKKEINDLRHLMIEEKEQALANTIYATRRDTSRRVRASLKGKIGEQMAPLLEEFHSKYELADARFIGHPIDYVIFKNLTKIKEEKERGIPSAQRSEIEVVIADIKVGSSSLSTEQRKIRDAIQSNRVGWDEIRIDIKETDISELVDDDISTDATETAMGPHEVVYVNLEEGYTIENRYCDSCRMILEHRVERIGGIESSTCLSCLASFDEK
jgi:predicted Holliday junction resolvase-like endonuclease